MSLTREQFYTKAIRPNMGRFATDIKVREIIPYLPCLTISDREEIEAKKEQCGNYNAVQTLLDNLRRRENWIDEFITALRKCELGKMADEMSDIYDRIRGITSAPKPTDAPAPSSTATATITTATVHTVPPITPPLLIPPPGAASVHLTAPSNPATQKSYPAPVLQVPETQQVQQVPSPAPAPTPEPVSQAEITPPVIAPSQAAPDMHSPIQSKVPTHTGEAVTRTPVLIALDVPGVTITSSAGESPISTSGAHASISNTSQIQLTRPCSPSQSSGNIQVQTEVKDKGTSEKFPVQDTNPSLRQEGTFQGPEEMSDPTANEDVQRHNSVGLPVSNAQSNLNRTTQATTSTPTEVVAHAPHSIEQEYFSKPGTLEISEPHRIQQNRAGTLPVLQEDPCSLVSGDLEISRETASSTDSRQVTSPAEQTSTSSSSTPLLNNPPYTSAQLTNNQPEEDHYESVCENQTLRHVFHVAEEPPAENLNGQPPSMLLRSRVNFEKPPTMNHVGTENVAHVCVPSVDVAEASDHKSPTIIAREQECNAAAAAATIQQPEQREEGRPELFRINNVHVVAAAGIVLSAVFLAWKLNH